MKKLLIISILLFASQSAAMETTINAKIGHQAFLNVVNIGEINELDCWMRPIDQLDEALYNATFYNQIDALDLLFKSGANPNSIAAKLAHIKAQLQGNKKALAIFEQNGVLRFNTIDQSFLYAMNWQAADLIYDFMKMHISRKTLSEVALKQALKIAIKKDDWLVLTHLVMHVDHELNSFALQHAVKAAFSSKDVSLVTLIIKAGFNKKSIHAKQALADSLLSENTELRRLLFDTDITLDYIRVKHYKARKTKEKN